MSLRVRPAAAFLFVMVGAAPAISAQIEEGRIPLQTAMSELSRFRDAYGENYNRKDLTALASMYDTSAVVIMPNGAVLKGRAAISQSMTSGGPLPHMVIESDSVRVFGNTAIDFGTIKQHPNGAPEVVSRYLVVLRRGYTEWKLVYVAQTPVTN
jgi:ketosteroid isomerase-like protein